MYISAILDCFDGAIIGLSMNTNKRSEICENSMKSAVSRYGKSENLIFHSDRGSQYTSKNYRKLLSKFRIKQSMGKTGSCFDNARMESFFATLKKELIYDIDYKNMSIDELKLKIFQWVEIEYNQDRPYSANLNNLPPLQKRKEFNDVAMFSGNGTAKTNSLISVA